MKGKNTYRDRLKQDLDSLIDALELSDLQKHFLRSRWLDQVLGMEGRADACQCRYYALRLVAIIGGVIIPALVSLNVRGATVSGAVSWITFVLSLMVAISLAVEEFLRFGERWRHYRRLVESLKNDGWQFFSIKRPLPLLPEPPGGLPRVRGRGGRDPPRGGGGLHHAGEAGKKGQRGRLKVNRLKLPFFLIMSSKVPEIWRQSPDRSPGGVPRIQISSARRSTTCRVTGWAMPLSSASKVFLTARPAPAWWRTESEITTSPFWACP